MVERPSSDVRGWSPPQVVEWLEHLDLKQYGDLFLENDIDGEALVLLDDSSLRELGVASVGHRMTLLGDIFQLKQQHDIQIEPGDWVPQNFEIFPGDISECHALLQRQGDRISELEFRVSQLSASLLRLREDVVGLARATDKPDAVQQAAPLDMPQGPPSGRSLTTPYGQSASPRPATNNYMAYSSAPTARPITRGQIESDSNPSVKRVSAPKSLSPIPVSANKQQASSFVCTLAPISDAVGQMLQKSGVQTEILPSDEPATLDDTTQTLLTLALRKYQVRGDAKEFALFIRSSSSQRCLTLEEKPLLILQKLREARNQPWVVVQHISDIESPIELGEKKLQSRRKDAGNKSKNEAMRLRARILDPNESQAEERAFGVSQWLMRADISGKMAEQKLKSAKIMGPAANVFAQSSQSQTFALAIYPYESEREDEFDIQAGDAFIVLAKAKGWWALRRDSLADGQGDVYVSNDLNGSETVEIWTGWVPAGCLLETSRPIADLLFVQVNRARSLSSNPISSEDKNAPYRSLRHALIHAPLPLAIVLSSGTQGAMLAPFETTDGTLVLQTNERLRVFKRYNHWSYCIVDGVSQARGWVPSWRTFTITDRSHISQTKFY
ncbi:hypothetical protein MPSI1_001800 [Malassezia psittaci]|uniref:Uncharacterized protein n=1 Tax=Malassezia psittaci TaxID=1821823 RepID=A0AAF0FED8_9BASI|nr:hypothetical protein MPSI1_001800 [Malassezia psittaci]